VTRDKPPGKMPTGEGYDALRFEACVELEKRRYFRADVCVWVPLSAKRE